MTVPFLLNGGGLVLPRDACDLLSDEYFILYPNASCPVLSDVVLVPCVASYQGMTCRVRHFKTDEWDLIEEGSFDLGQLDGFDALGVVVYSITADHSTTSADFVETDSNLIRALRKTRQYPLPKYVLRELSDWSDAVTLFQVKTAMPSGYLSFDDNADASVTPIVIKAFRHVSFEAGRVKMLLMDSYGVVLTTLPYDEAEAAVASTLYQSVDDSTPSRPDYLSSEPDRQFAWRFDNSITTVIGQGPFCLDVDHRLLSEMTLDVTVVSNRIMFGRPSPTKESTRYMTITSTTMSATEWTLRVWYVRPIRNVELHVSYEFSMTENSYENGAFAVCSLGRSDGRNVIALISFDPDGYANQMPFDRNLVVSRTVDLASVNGSNPEYEDNDSGLGLSDPSDTATGGDDWVSTPSTFAERMNRLPLLGKLMCFTLLLVTILATIRIISRISKRNKK